MKYLDEFLKGATPPTAKTDKTARQVMVRPNCPEDSLTKPTHPLSPLMGDGTDELVGERFLASITWDVALEDPAKRQQDAKFTISPGRSSFVVGRLTSGLNSTVTCA
jgi:hypothetical protein